ncbi:MAG: hypothetical protein Q7R93_01285 [bacterium]|nr:hypothetical protein [bacterium]
MNAPNPNAITQFVVGKSVVLTGNWTPVDQPKLVFHQGTEGKVEQVFPERAEVEISMKFPHGPMMVTVIPASLLRRG